MVSFNKPVIKEKLRLNNRRLDSLEQTFWFLIGGIHLVENVVLS